MTELHRSPRQVAAVALQKVLDQGAYSNLILDQLCRRAGLQGQDAAFAGALFYGALERVLTLDAILTRFSRQPLEKLSPAVRSILRITLYQLYYMDRVPDHAAVDEGVNLTRTMKVPRAAGFVNGILRNVLRQNKPLPKLPEDPTGRLSLAYSCPQWLIRHWIRSYGEARAEQILQSSLGRPPVYLRANTLRTTAQDLLRRLEEAGIQGRLMEPDGCIQVEKTGSFERLSPFQEGLFHIQDQASQFCVRALEPKPGERLLDVCAAPGGKTLTAAQYMENTGEILACDLHENKLPLITASARRLGIQNISVRGNDGAIFRPEFGLFDRVLCDVPCSGLGIIRRKPEIKYKPQEFLQEFPEIQYKILQTSSNYLKKGGILVYSTCTLNPAENEQVVARLLQEMPELVPCPLPQEMGEGYQRTFFPDVQGSDGFFLARLQKKW